MTGTSVKGVSSYLVNSQTNRIPADCKGDMTGNFTNVLNKQLNSEGQKPEVGQKPAGVLKDVKQTEQNGTQTQNNAEMALKDAKVQPSEEMPVRGSKIQDKDRKALEEAAETMVAAIAEELDISVEEMLQILEEMGMVPMDLLKPEQLLQVWMAVNNETDSMSLVTDETMYQALQELTGLQQTTWEQLEVQTGIPAEELRMMAEDQEVQEAAVQTEETGEEEMLPLIEVDTEGEIPTVQEQKNVEETGRSVTEPTEGTTETEETETAVGAVKGQEHQKQEEPLSKFTGNGEEQPVFQHTADSIWQKTGVQEQTEPIFAADTKEIMKQIMDFMRIQMKPGMTELQMQLHPESLGNVHVRIAAKEGVMTAQFTAQNESIKTVLESQMMQLKDSLQTQGIKVEEIEVTIASHGFERNLEQGREQNHQTDAGKRRNTRRLNLNDSMLQEEELTEEDAVSAEMMRANGNTVDYTA